MNTNFLLASLIWGALGLAYFIYGKKQGSWPPMIGGVAMIALSYFASSALWISLGAAVLIGAICLLLKRGY